MQKHLYPHPRSLATFLVLALVLSQCAFVCSGNTSKQALTAVNKYANSLDAFQKAVVVAHKNGTVTDAEDRMLQTKIIQAAKTGTAVDAAIIAVQHGGDATSYITAAQNALDDLINSGITQIKNPTTQAELKLAISASSALLANVIVLVNQLKNQSPAPAPKPAG